MAEVNAWRRWRAGHWLGHTFRLRAIRSSRGQVAAANGVKVLFTRNATPTPVVSYNVMNRKAGGGVIITSSHNPAPYNGFKIKTQVGASAEPDVIDDVEARIHGITIDSVKRVAFKDAVASGQVELIDAKEAYLEQVHRLVDVKPIQDAGLTVAIDAMYGAGSGYFQSLLLGGKTKLVEAASGVQPRVPWHRARAHSAARGFPARDDPIAACRRGPGY